MKLKEIKKKEDEILARRLDEGYFFFTEFDAEEVNGLQMEKIKTFQKIHKDKKIWGLTDRWELEKFKKDNRWFYILVATNDEEKVKKTQKKIKKILNTEKWSVEVVEKILNEVEKLGEYIYLYLV